MAVEQTDSSLNSEKLLWRSMPFIAPISEHEIIIMAGSRNLNKTQVLDTLTGVVRNIEVRIKGGDNFKHGASLQSIQNMQGYHKGSVVAAMACPGYQLIMTFDPKTMLVDFNEPLKPIQRIEGICFEEGFLD